MHVSIDTLFFPHITVWGSCCSLGTRRCFRIPPRRLTPKSQHTITLITAQLITPLHHTNLSPHSLSPYFSHPTHTTSSHHHFITPPLHHTNLSLSPHSLSPYFSHPTQTSSSHHHFITPTYQHHYSSRHFIKPTYHHTASHRNSHVQLLTAIRYHHTSHSHSSQHNSSHHLFTATSSHGTHHCTTYHISLITSHLTHHTTTHRTQSLRVAGDTKPSSCCARGRRWAAAGFRMAGAVHRAFVWQAPDTEPGGAAARVVASWPVRGRQLARGWRSCGKRTTQGLLNKLRAWSPPGPRLAVV